MGRPVKDKKSRPREPKTKPGRVAVTLTVAREDYDRLAAAIDRLARRVRFETRVTLLEK